MVIAQMTVSMMKDQKPSTTDNTTQVDHLDRLITEQDAAEFLGYTTRALQNWRVRGGGPEYIKVSARSIRYQRRDLIQWIEDRRTRHSSEMAAA